jgi:tripartite ATP-independent transporter DctM subunit
VELSPIALTLVLFGSMFLLLMTGLPLTFVIGGIGTLAVFFLWGPEALYNVAARAFQSTMSFVLLAIPLFILMASILQRSGIADALYDTIHKWLGGLNGGLAAGTVVIAAMFAAMSGVAAAATISLGLIALPAMLKRKYNKVMVTGAIQAGGALGILIPPSVEMIVFALIARLSVGRMFMGGVFPGLLLASFFIIYILVRCYLRPSLGPALPPEERATWKEKFVSLRQIVLPLMVIGGVLGSIYLGIATPTESAAVGILGALVSAAIYGTFSWSMLKEAAETTLRVSTMIMWILFGSFVFSSTYIALGASEVVEQALSLMPGGRWGVLIGMQLSFFALGCILDTFGIIMITAPLYLPIIKALGFDPVWFGILYVMNVEMAFLTPPYGICLFYMKAIVPKEVTMMDIYRSIIPFVGLQALGLIIVMIFPQIAMWLPGTMVK